MAVFPPLPVDTIDWSNVGFHIREVNGHIESTYSKDTGQWTPLRFVADPRMRIHGMSPALNYGQQAYEGLKAFRMAPERGGGIAIFRPDRNAQRMQRSAAAVSMPAVPTDMFIAACRAATALNAAFVPPHDANGCSALYVRPQLYGSGPQLGLSPPEEHTFAVFVVPTGAYHGLRPVRALVLDDFDRCAPRGCGHAKVGGNYAPVWRWSDAARADGFGITLHLDSARHEEIDEFSSSAFIGVVGDGSGSGVTVVVPDSTCVIDSVTSASVQEIARSWGWRVEKRAVRYDELPRFSEVMAAGTAASLVPIRSITRRRGGGGALLDKGVAAAGTAVAVDSAAGTETVTYVPDEREDAGPICQKLMRRLQGIQRGTEEDSFGWRCEIGEEDLKIEGAPTM